nr:Tn3 family transposase [Cupriavidus sp. P-10]
MQWARHVVYLRLDLPKLWGKGKKVAADGTQYDVYKQNLLIGMHFRYRRMGAVAYRHVADNYIAVFRHFQSGARSPRWLAGWKRNRPPTRGSRGRWRRAFARPRSPSPVRSARLALTAASELPPST